LALICMSFLVMFRWQDNWPHLICLFHGPRHGFSNC
jgi:hypothetical protein